MVDGGGDCDDVMEKTGFVYLAVSSSLLSLDMALRMSWRSRMRVGLFWHRLMKSAQN